MNASLQYNSMKSIVVGYSDNLRSPSIEYSKFLYNAATKYAMRAAFIYVSKLSNRICSAKKSLTDNILGDRDALISILCDEVGINRE